MPEYGNRLWRNGECIFVDKEPHVFTALIRHVEDQAHLESLPRVEGLKPMLGGKVVRVKIDPDYRDLAMNCFRLEEPEGGVCHHAYCPVGSVGTRYYLTDCILVEFQKGVSTPRAKALLWEARLVVVRRHDDCLYQVRVTSASGRNPLKVSEWLSGQEEVNYAEPNLINRFQNHYTPTDTYYSNQWHLSAIDSADSVAAADISAPEAWDTTKGRRTVTVAILDDGFDLEHPDLSGEGKVVYPKDYADGDADPFPQGSDYHGTPVAGLAIAEENDTGVIGVAPQCAFMPVRIPLSTLDDALFLEILSYVGPRADVISNSWGPVPSYAPLSSSVYNKIATLSSTGGPRGRGCVIVFSAGNYDTPIEEPDSISYTWYNPSTGAPATTTGPLLNGFAAHPDVLAVSASTSMNAKALYSNWGYGSGLAEISLCAPSNNFNPQTLNGMPGRGIWTTDNEIYGQDFTPGSQYTGSFGGTSASAPIVAGAAALVISANIGLNSLQVRQILKDTADKITDSQVDPITGQAGGVYVEGYSRWFGYGKVNAYAAISRALGTTSADQGPTPEPEPPIKRVPAPGRRSRGVAITKHFTNHPYGQYSTYYTSATRFISLGETGGYCGKCDSLSKIYKDMLGWGYATGYGHTTILGESQDVLVSGLLCEPGCFPPEDDEDFDCDKECLQVLDYPTVSAFTSSDRRSVGLFDNFVDNKYYIWVAYNQDTTTIGAFLRVEEHILPIPNTDSVSNQWKRLGKRMLLTGSERDRLDPRSRLTFIFSDMHSGWPSLDCKALEELEEICKSPHPHRQFSLIGILLTTDPRAPSINPAALSGTAKEHWEIVSIPATEDSMHCYLTGSRDGDAIIQDAPWMSLGGWASGTELASGTPNNLFSYVSQKKLVEGGTEYACIVLRNTSMTSWMHALEIHGLNLQVESGTTMRYHVEMNYASAPISTVLIEDPETSPGGGFTLESEPIEGNLGDLPPGGQVYLWIERTIEAGKVAFEIEKIEIAALWSLGELPTLNPDTGEVIHKGKPYWKIFEIHWTCGPTIGQDDASLDLSLAALETEDVSMDLSLQKEEFLDVSLSLSLTTFLRDSVAVMASSLKAVSKQEI